MLKRLGFLLVLVVAAGYFMGAASMFGKVYTAQRDTLTVDAQYSASAWDSGTYVAAVGLDSACFSVCVTFNAELDPYERLYVGFDDDTVAGAVTVPDMCTLIVAPPLDMKNKHTASFTLRDRDMTPNGNTAQTDTFFVLFATGGGGQKIPVTDIVFDVVAVDSAF